ncbi:hypothetical protein Hanom_Chr11g01010931 [Helianthus anomalus]
MLDPATNTARYRLVYKSVKVLDRIPQMQMEQDILENMALWLFRHDIFYEDKDASQALRFQHVACYCYYRGIHAGSSWSEAAH